MLRRPLHWEGNTLSFYLGGLDRLKLAAFFLCISSPDIKGQHAILTIVGYKVKTKQTKKKSMWKSIDAISSRVTATHHMAFMFADMESFLSFCLQSRTGHALHVSALECTNAHATERHMGSVAKLLSSTCWVRIARLQCIKVIRLMTFQPCYRPFFTCNIWKNKKNRINQLLGLILQPMR